MWVSLDPRCGNPSAQHCMRSGACGVPLAWSLQSEERALSVRLKPAGPQDGATLWSLPIAAGFPEGGVRHVPIPIQAPQRPAGAPGSEDPSSSYLRHIQTMLTAAGPAWELEGPRVLRRIKHHAQCVHTPRLPASLPACIAVLAPGACRPPCSLCGATC